jgi:hypothetical protein
LETEEYEFDSHCPDLFSYFILSSIFSMPQLDKLIILVQYKIFLILFLIVYFCFIIFIIPKLYKSLFLRKKKIENSLFFNFIYKSQLFSKYNNYKNYLNNYFYFCAFFFNLHNAIKKNILSFVFDDLKNKNLNFYFLFSKKL